MQSDTGQITGKTQSLVRRVQMHLHFWTRGDLLGGDRVVDTAAVSGISTFGRVDYDLNTDIKGFDHHFVVSKAEQRHWGINAERLIATGDVTGSKCC